MPTKFDLDATFIRKLAKLLEETGLSEIEYAEGDRKIRCAVTRGTIVHAAPVTATAVPTAAAPAEAAMPAVVGTPVTSPMVGTVYLAPAPDASPFVKVGDRIKPGDTLLIIEAMKVMNPIKAQQGGTVTQILVTSGKPVEFGETLLVVA